MKLKINNNSNGLFKKQQIGQVLLIVVVTVLLVYCLVQWGEQLWIFVVNFAVAMLGGIIAIELMIYAYRRLDNLTSFNTEEKLKENNIAVGIMVAGLFIGVGIVIGLVVALGVS